jgi:hypothetical protein
MTAGTIDDETKIPIKHLQRIAEFYEFPMAVFFAPTMIFKEKTRDNALSRKAEAFDKIREIVEEAVKA